MCGDLPQDMYLKIKFKKLTYWKILTYWRTSKCRHSRWHCWSTQTINKHLSHQPWRARVPLASCKHEGSGAVTRVERELCPKAPIFRVTPVVRVGNINRSCFQPYLLSFFKIVCTFAFTFEGILHSPPPFVCGTWTHASGWSGWAMVPLALRAKMASYSCEG